MLTHDALTALDGAILQLEEELSREPDPLPQAPAVAAALRGGWPRARLSACLLRSGRLRRLAALGASGEGDAEATARLDVADPGEAAAAWDGYLTPMGRAVFVSSDHALLAVVLGPEAGDDDEAAARRGLSSLCDVFTRHALRRRLRQLEEENEALEHPASVGELAGVIAHEISDFLNLLLLQVAVLECRLSESDRADLAEVRRQGHQVSELVGRFQQYRKASPRGRPLVDLSEAVRAGVEQARQEVAEAAGEARLELADGVPVPGDVTGLRRLARLLVTNALRAAAGRGPVVVATESSGGAARLRVDAPGPALTQEQLGQLFSPASRLPGVDALEMAACRSLARRLRGRLSASALPEGGARVVVEFEPGERGG